MNTNTMTPIDRSAHETTGYIVDLVTSLEKADSMLGRIGNMVYDNEAKFTDHAKKMLLEEKARLGIMMQDMEYIFSKI